MNIQTNLNVPLDVVHVLEKKRKSRPGIGIAVGLLVMVFFLLPGTAKAVVCTSQVTTGNWSTIATWGCGHVPAGGDDVTIASGNTITVDITTAALNVLTVNGTLTFDNTGTGRTLTTKSATIGSSGVLNIATGGAPTTSLLDINSSSTFTNNGTINLVNGSNQVNLRLEAPAITLNGNAMTFGDLDGGPPGQSGLNRFTLDADITVQNLTGSGNDKTHPSTFQITDNTTARTLTIKGNVTFDDGVAREAGQIRTSGAAHVVIVQGNITALNGSNGGNPGSFGLSTGTLKLTGATTTSFTLGGQNNLNSNDINAVEFGDGTNSKNINMTFNVDNTNISSLTSFTVKNGATLSVSIGAIGCDITFANSGGTLAVDSGAILDMTSTGVIRTSTAGTVTLNMGATGLIKTATSSTSGIGFTATSGSFQIQASAAWITTSIDTNGTVEYNANGNQTVTDRNYNNLTISGTTGTKTMTLAATRTLNGSFTLSGGASFTLTGANTLNVKGNWTSSSSGSFTHSSGVVQFNGSAAQTITGTLTFLSVIINNAAGVNLNSDININSVLTLTNGDLVTGASTLTMPNTATSAGTTDVVGNVKRPGFVSGGGALSFGNPFNSIQINSGTAPIDINVNLDKQSPTDFGNSVRRTYTITPNGGSGISATVRLHYRDAELNGNIEDSTLHLWRKDGSTWNDQGQSNTDSTNNWVERNSVGTFSPWTIAGPTGPTAVRLTRFGAAAYSDGVELSWKTGFEVNNLGYLLYREQNGKRIRVTPSIVAGSALTVGPGSRLTAGYSYSWFDPKGRPDSGYYLEAVDLNGERAMMGPIYPAVVYQGDVGNSLSPARRRAMLLNEISSAAAESLAARTPFSEQSWAAALKTSARSETLKLKADSLSIQQAIAAGQAVKIQVRRTGWYRVSQAELVAAGLDSSVNGRMLQLYVDGEEVPIRLSGDGSRLTTSDTLEFYGVALDTPTTDTRTYWLITGSSPGKRITVKRNKVKPGDHLWAETVGVRNFAYTTERKEKLIYFANLLNGDAENIFGSLVITDPVTQTLAVRNFDREGAGQAQLEIALQGATLLAHRVLVQLNGNNVGTISFEGREHSLTKFSVDRALLRDGDNTISLNASGGDSDVSLLDWIRLTYAHQYRADQNALQFSVPGGQTVRVTGFTTPNVRVIDVTNPDSVSEIEVIASPSEAGYAVKLQTKGFETRTLIAFTDELSEHAASVTANQPSSWNSSENGADMVIVTHKDFRQAIEPLAALRRGQGLNVAIVDIDDVYDEFSYGTHTPLALKSFLSWAASHWRRAPRYLLLVGDSSYDPRDYLDQGANDFVPTKLLDTAFMETSSDDWLADFNGDSFADMAVGRLPGRTSGQVSLMVTKIMAYEHERDMDGPLRGALLVADTGFEQESSQTQALLPPEMAVQTINRGEVGNDDIARGEIVQALDQGPLIVNYYGHGSIDVWTGAGLLDSALGSGLTNTNQLSLFVMMTCLNGYAHDAYIDSLGESLLKAENGGAVAVWASSGFTEPQPQFVMGSEFYRQLFGAQSLRLGEVIRNAKMAVSDQDVRRTWILLGDPAMRLR